jgi:NTE family protein
LNRPKIGLVLGGGGSRGLAHIGVLEVLVREGIPFDFIVGTSMGGVVGTLFALGNSPAEIAAGTVAIQGSFLINRNILSAKARQRTLRDQLASALADKTFADLNLPVTLMAVDLDHGQEVALCEGELLPAILATSAVPGAFPPVKLNGRQLSDGGVIDSLSTHMAYQQGADKIIAVDVYPPLPKDGVWSDPFSVVAGVQLPISGIFSNGNGAESEKDPNIFAAMWRSVRVMTWYLHQQRLEAHPPDVLLRPNVGHYASLDFKDVDGPIIAGRLEAERQLSNLKALCGHHEAVNQSSGDGLP